MDSMPRELQAIVAKNDADLPEELKALIESATHDAGSTEQRELVRLSIIAGFDLGIALQREEHELVLKATEDVADRREQFAGDLLALAILSQIARNTCQKRAEITIDLGAISEDVADQHARLTKQMSADGNKLTFIAHID
jgi:hypothetical protein